MYYVSGVVIRQASADSYDRTQISILPAFGCRDFDATHKKSSHAPSVFSVSLSASSFAEPFLAGAPPTPWEWVTGYFGN